MAFQTYLPTNLTFQDYIAVVQTSRVLADGFDKKVQCAFSDTLRWLSNDILHRTETCYVSLWRQQ